MAAAVNADLEKDVRVDVNAIEKSLADLWRSNKDAAEDEALTRAALWNVIGHASTDEHRAQASEVLGRASAAVPQRTIVVRANPAAEPDIAAWISANCHLVGGGKQVCSEEIAISAGGDRIHRVPPLVNALLIPDMPVAIWWLGDLPNEHESYVEAMLDPADRLIVDSVHFDSPADLALVSRVAAQTRTAPADLNWIRLEEWRAATAAIFDPPDIRTRLDSIRRVRLVSAVSDEEFFGQIIEALLFASWITAQVDHESIDFAFDRKRQSTDVGQVVSVEINFEDGSSASIMRDSDRGVLIANVDGNVSVPQAVTRCAAQRLDELIVRQLKRVEGDRVLLKVLPIASRLSKRFAR